MANQAKEYFELDNSKRNMNEMVNFHNGSDHDLTMTGVTSNVKERPDGGTVTENNEHVYGVCKAGTTISVPRFVAEYWALRHVQYNLDENSEVATLIRKFKGDLVSTEGTYQKNEKERAEQIANQRTVTDAQLESAKAIIELAANMKKDREEKEESKDIEKKNK